MKTIIIEKDFSGNAKLSETNIEVEPTPVMLLTNHLSKQSTEFELIVTKTRQWVYQTESNKKACNIFLFSKMWN